MKLIRHPLPCLMGYQKTGEILHTYEQSFGPVAPLSNRGSITIMVPPSTEDYTDLTDAYFIVKLQITTADGTRVTAANKVCAPHILSHCRNIDILFQVATCNALLPSLFEGVSLQVNNRNCGPVHNLHAQTSFVSCLINYSNDAKSNLRKSIIWVKDLGKPLSAKFDENLALLSRQREILKDEVELRGKNKTKLTTTS